MQHPHALGRAPPQAQVHLRQCKLQRRALREAPWHAATGPLLLTCWAGAAAPSWTLVGVALDRGRPKLKKPPRPAADFGGRSRARRNCGSATKSSSSLYTLGHTRGVEGGQVRLTIPPGHFRTALHSSPARPHLARKLCIQPFFLGHRSRARCCHAAPQQGFGFGLGCCCLQKNLEAKYLKTFIVAHVAAQGIRVPFSARLQERSRGAAHARCC